MIVASAAKLLKIGQEKMIFTRDVFIVKILAREITIFPEKNKWMIKNKMKRKKCFPKDGVRRVVDPSVSLDSDKTGRMSRLI